MHDPSESVGPTVTTWNAYSTAFVTRYGIPPVRNAMVNGQLANLVRRLGEDDAPKVAAYYVTCNDRRYVTDQHSVGLLLNQCEGLRTRWATRDRDIAQNRLSPTGQQTADDLQRWAERGDAA